MLPSRARSRTTSGAGGAVVDGTQTSFHSGALRLSVDDEAPDRASSPDDPATLVTPVIADGIPPIDSAPLWFRRALAVPFSDGSVDVGGVPIHYLAWGEPGRRGLVFVHGGGAHAHWWTHLAATFAEGFRVVALDLSGHGDSGHRDAYDIEQWTEEVMAAARAGHRRQAGGDRSLDGRVRHHRDCGAARRGPHGRDRL